MRYSEAVITAEFDSAIIGSNPVISAKNFKKVYIMVKAHDFNRGMKGQQDIARQEKDVKTTNRLYV